MANPKFPRRSRRAPAPKMEAPTYHFDQFSPKLNEKEDNWTGTGCCTLWSANDIYPEKLSVHLSGNDFRIWGKVIFSQASVILPIGGWGSASREGSAYGDLPPGGSASQGGWADPPPRILWDMINTQVVCILLECILVEFNKFSGSDTSSWSWFKNVCFLDMVYTRGCKFKSF